MLKSTWHSLRSPLQILSECVRFCLAVALTVTSWRSPLCLQSHLIELTLSDPRKALDGGAGPQTKREIMKTRYSPHCHLHKGNAKWSPPHVQNLPVTSHNTWLGLSEKWECALAGATLCAQWIRAISVTLELSALCIPWCLWPAASVFKLFE